VRSSLVLGSEQVLEAGGLLDELGVHADGQGAVVGAHPLAVGVLEGVRDRVEVRRLVGLDEVLADRGLGEGVADVEDVGLVGLALEGLDGLQLLGAGDVGGLDLDL
jgi:hypothetical protein